jgi:hypothetical protein
MMKKNTESIGSIFDPLPSDLKGNIQCTSNPEEGVVGYLTASSLNQKRIFITPTEADWNFNYNCLDLFYIPNDPDSIRAFMPGVLPIDLIVQDFKEVWMAAAPRCVDCVTRGGNLAMPSYW